MQEKVPFRGNQFIVRLAEIGDDGRDAGYIAEELVISKNTVRTHMKNIFAKTGVHSRQELIDLLETVER